MALIIFILGLLIGSFLNVCIYRIPKGLSVITPPSTCCDCGNRLMAIDLIPVISYVLLKGKCRYCNSRISLKYPAIELITGCGFFISYHFIGLNLYLLKFLVLASILITVAFIDLEYLIIPDSIIVFTGISGIILNVLVKDISIQSSVLGFVVGGGFLLIIAIISKGAMGGGDIKLMAALGIYAGFKGVILSLLFSFIIGGIISMILMITKVKGPKDPIPFGPFISIGTFTALLFYKEIIYFYLRYIAT